jgi:broad specificity phosphatase PhoE
VKRHSYKKPARTASNPDDEEESVVRGKPIGGGSRRSAPVLVDSDTHSLILVRHGERMDHTNKNWAEKDPTPDDPPLSGFGRSDAMLFGRYWAKRTLKKGGRRSMLLSYIATSPMQRCLETAAWIRRGMSEVSEEFSQLPIVVAPDLAEYHSKAIYPRGRPQLKSAASPTLMEEITGGNVFFHMNTEQSINYPETAEDLRARIGRCLASLVEEAAFKSIFGENHPMRRSGKGTGVRVLAITHADALVAGAEALAGYIHLGTGFSPPYLSTVTVSREIQVPTHSKGNEENSKSAGWNLIGGVGVTLHREPVFAHDQTRRNQR